MSSFLASLWSRFNKGAVPVSYSSESVQDSVSNVGVSETISGNAISGCVAYRTFVSAQTSGLQNSLPDDSEGAHERRYISAIDRCKNAVCCLQSDIAYQTDVSSADDNCGSRRVRFYFPDQYIDDDCSSISDSELPSGSGNTVSLHLDDLGSIHGFFECFVGLFDEFPSVTPSVCSPLLSNAEQLELDYRFLSVDHRTCSFCCGELWNAVSSNSQDTRVYLLCRYHCLPMYHLIERAEGTPSQVLSPYDGCSCCPGKFAIFKDSSCRCRLGLLWGCLRCGFRRCPCGQHNVGFHPHESPNHQSRCPPCLFIKIHSNNPLCGCSDCHEKNCTDEHDEGPNIDGCHCDYCYSNFYESHPYAAACICIACRAVRDDLFNVEHHVECMCSKCSDTFLDHVYSLYCLCSKCCECRIKNYPECHCERSDDDCDCDSCVSTKTHEEFYTRIFPIPDPDGCPCMRCVGKNREDDSCVFWETCTCSVCVARRVHRACRASQIPCVCTRCLNEDENILFKECDDSIINMIQDTSLPEPQMGVGGPSGYFMEHVLRRFDVQYVTLTQTDKHAVSRWLFRGMSIEQRKDVSELMLINGVQSPAMVHELLGYNIGKCVLVIRDNMEAPSGFSSVARMSSLVDEPSFYFERFGRHGIFSKYYGKFLLTDNQVEDCGRCGGDVYKAYKSDENYRNEMNDYVFHLCVNGCHEKYGIINAVVPQITSDKPHKSCICTDCGSNTVMVENYDCDCKIGYYEACSKCRLRVCGCGLQIPTDRLVESLDDSVGYHDCYVLANCQICTGKLVMIKHSNVTLCTTCHFRNDLTTGGYSRGRCGVCLKDKIYLTSGSRCQCGSYYSKNCIDCHHVECVCGDCRCQSCVSKNHWQRCWCGDTCDELCSCDLCHFYSRRLVASLCPCCSGQLTECYEDGLTCRRCDYTITSLTAPNATAIRGNCVACSSINTDVIETFCPCRMNQSRKCFDCGVLSCLNDKCKDHYRGKCHSCGSYHTNFYSDECECGGGEAIRCRVCACMACTKCRKFPTYTHVSDMDCIFCKNEGVTILDDGDCYECGRKYTINCERCDMTYCHCGCTECYKCQKLNTRRFLENEGVCDSCGGTLMHFTKSECICGARTYTECEDCAEELCECGPCTCAFCSRLAMPLSHRRCASCSDPVTTKRECCGIETCDDCKPNPCYCKKCIMCNSETLEEMRTCSCLSVVRKCSTCKFEMCSNCSEVKSPPCSACERSTLNIRDFSICAERCGMTYVCRHCNHMECVKHKCKCLQCTPMYCGYCFSNKIRPVGLCYCGSVKYLCQCLHNSCPSGHVTFDHLEFFGCPCTTCGDKPCHLVDTCPNIVCRCSKCSSVTCGRFCLDICNHCEEHMCNRISCVCEYCGEINSASTADGCMTCGVNFCKCNKCEECGVKWVACIHGRPYQSFRDNLNVVTYVDTIHEGRFGCPCKSCNLEACVDCFGGKGCLCRVCGGFGLCECRRLLAINDPYWRERSIDFMADGSLKTWLREFSVASDRCVCQNTQLVDCVCQSSVVQYIVIVSDKTIDLVLFNALTETISIEGVYFISSRYRNYQTDAKIYFLDTSGKLITKVTITTLYDFAVKMAMVAMKHRFVHFMKQNDVPGHFGSNYSIYKFVAFLGSMGMENLQDVATAQGYSHDFTIQNDRDMTTVKVTLSDSRKYVAHFSNSDLYDPPEYTFIEMSFTFLQSLQPYYISRGYSAADMDSSFLISFIHGSRIYTFPIKPISTYVDDDDLLINNIRDAHYFAQLAHANDACRIAGIPTLMETFMSYIRQNYSNDRYIYQLQLNMGVLPPDAGGSFGFPGNVRSLDVDTARSWDRLLNRRVALDSDTYSIPSLVPSNADLPSLYSSNAALDSTEDVVLQIERSMGSGDYVGGHLTEEASMQPTGVFLQNVDNEIRINNISNNMNRPWDMYFGAVRIAHMMVYNYYSNGRMLRLGPKTKRLFDLFPESVVKTLEPQGTLLIPRVGNVHRVVKHYDSGKWRKCLLTLEVALSKVLLQRDVSVSEVYQLLLVLAKS